jgi:hypothetical protein
MACRAGRRYDAAMRGLFESGWIAVLVVAVTVAEFAVLALVRARTGRGIGAADAATMLLPGVCLVASLGLALRGADWVWIALALTASLAAHLADVARRWR